MTRTGAASDQQLQADLSAGQQPAWYVIVIALAVVCVIVAAAHLAGLERQVAVL